MPTAGFSNEQIRPALNDLELAGVVEPHKAGYWTWRTHLDDVLHLIRELPGGVDTLDVLAHPVGWSVIARLARGHVKRNALNACGDTARVSEQLKPLRHMKAVEKKAGLIVLLVPEAHRRVQDRLDEAAQDLATETFYFAGECRRRDLARMQVGASYCSNEHAETREAERLRISFLDRDANEDRAIDLE